MSCTICHQPGHNSRRCPQAAPRPAPRLVRLGPPPAAAPPRAAPAPPLPPEVAETLAVCAVRVSALRADLLLLAGGAAGDDAHLALLQAERAARYVERVLAGLSRTEGGGRV